MTGKKMKIFFKVLTLIFFDFARLNTLYFRRFFYKILSNYLFLQHHDYILSAAQMN